jgi:hypothetical protein
LRNSSRQRASRQKAVQCYKPQYTPNTPTKTLRRNCPRPEKKREQPQGEETSGPTGGRHEGTSTLESEVSEFLSGACKTCPAVRKPRSTHTQYKYPRKQYTTSLKKSENEGAVRGLKNVSPCRKCSTSLSGDRTTRLEQLRVAASCDNQLASSRIENFNR